MGIKVVTQRNDDLISLTYIHRLVDVSIILYLLAKLPIICVKSKEYFKVVDAEDAAVADTAALARGKQLDVAPAAVEIVSQGDTISQFENFPS